MQIKLYPVFFLLFLILGLSNAYSQKSPAKFGKIDIKDLEATICPIDSNAHAYYIFDYGKITFTYMGTKVSSRSTYSDERGFEMTQKRHYRIKILDNQAFDWANIEIPLYHDKASEKISNIRGVTYSLENGKIIKTKFNKKDLTTEETSTNLKTIKFAMPNVKVGSVIEIEYSINSPYTFNLPIIYFQHTIPTLYSEYNIATPEYLKYSKIVSGYHSIENKQENKPREVTIIYTQEKEGMGEGYKSASKINYTDNVSIYKGKDIPAFPIEKYLKTSFNYISKVKFELESTSYPGSATQYYSSTWSKVNAKMNEHYKILKKTNHLNNTKKSLLTSNQKSELLMNLTFEKIKNHFTWNRRNGKYPTTTLTEAYQAKEGNVADINLNLVMLLRELGFEANPVILSTQRNGIIHPAHASLSGLNYVIAMIKLEDKVYLLDATEPYSEVNLLPTRCLNGKGRVIGEVDEKWINLMNGKFVSVWSHDLTLEEDLTIKGKVKGKLKSYAAYHKRKALQKENGEVKSDTSDDDEENEEKEEDKNANRIIKNTIVKGADTLGSTIDVAYDFTETDYAETSGDLLYFSPAFDSYFKENPFKLEKREFPVEFNYPLQIQQIYSITIPDNYQISELPKPVITKSPDKTLSFMYQVSQTGNKINVVSMLNIRKNLFLPIEYQGLKQVFQLMIDKQKEMVVLKKKS